MFKKKNKRNLGTYKNEPIDFKYDTKIKLPVLAKRCDNYYYAYPTRTGWLFYRSRYLGKERNDEIIDINFDDWCHEVVNAIYEDNKEIYEQNKTYMKSLNEIKEYINTNEIMNNEDGTFLLKECYYGQEILKIIDKVLGEEK